MFFVYRGIMRQEYIFHELCENSQEISAFTGAENPKRIKERQMKFL